MDGTQTVVGKPPGRTGFTRPARRFLAQKLTRKLKA